MYDAPTVNNSRKEGVLAVLTDSKNAANTIASARIVIRRESGNQNRSGKRKRVTRITIRRAEFVIPATKAGI